MLVVVLVVEDVITMYDEGGILSLMYNGREGHSVLSTSKVNISKVKPALSQACISVHHIIINSFGFILIMHLIYCRKYNLIFYSYTHFLAVKTHGITTT